MKYKILLIRGFKDKLKFMQILNNKKKMKYKILLIRGFKAYKLNVLP